MADRQPEKPRVLPNPYASKGLPNPYARATVAESAPVHFTEEQAKARAAQKQMHAFHNPHAIKRPQPKGNVVKKPIMARPVVSSSSSDAVPATTSKQPGLDWWRSTEEDDASTLEYKRQMDRQQREKKKQDRKFQKQYGWWKGDVQYKADKPSNLLAYRMSGGYRTKRGEFNNFLQAQACPSQPPQIPHDSGDSSEDPLPACNSGLETPPTPPADVPPPPPEAHDVVPPPPAPASAPYNPTISAPPVRYSHVIEGAPVHHQPPPGGRDQSQVINKEPPAKRQKLSKAEAMMAKMGYKKGEGLGKNSDGITTHLEVKARKQNTRGRGTQVGIIDESDDEKSMNVKSQQVFDILGGHPTKRKEPGKFGEDSKVVVAFGCVDDVDWSADAKRNDGGIHQEMGQTFDNKFGRVERIFVDKASAARPTYIKFASELSALNAVNRFEEGYQFRGRKIRALFYNEAKFESSIFEY